MRPPVLPMLVLASSMAGPLLAKSQENVIINEKPVAPATLGVLQKFYGPLAPGRYWYDPFSGLWGFEGDTAAGQIMPGLDLGGELPADASAGNTNVFINGRELPAEELQFLRQYVINLSPGRYWLDSIGNLGKEGGPALLNLYAIDKRRSVTIGGQHGTPGLLFNHRSGFEATW